MKILHVITALGNGGAEATLYRLTTADARNAHHVVTLMDEGTYGERLIRAGIYLHALRMPRGRLTLQGIVKLYGVVRAVRPDVVQTWMYHGDLIGGGLARAAGVRNVVWGIRGPFDRKRTTLSTTLAVKLCAFMSTWVPRVIVCNSAYAAEAHLRAGYAPHKFVNIPNGYSISTFRPDPAARGELLRELRIDLSTSLIGMVARFDPHKDHENLFRALSRVVQTSGPIACLLVGDGMTMTDDRLGRLVRDYALEGTVRLLGPRNDIPRIMAALDIHVLSSAAESFPNVLAEAMACGTPCVTTDAGDAGLIVGNTGWVVPRFDTRALADAITDALHEMQDPTKSNARKRACRERIVENYSLERMIASYHRVWTSLAS